MFGRLKYFDRRVVIAISALVLFGAVSFGVGVYSVLYNQEWVLGTSTFSENPDRDPFKFDQGDAQEEPVNHDFSIFAPQISVNAPVYANVDGSNENAYLANVLRGVAHYQHKELDNVTVDGALPGQVGNVFLFGHSQIPGGSLENYQGVFNNLEELIEGDVIKVFYQGEEYQYEVKEGHVIEKTQVEYLAHTETETLTLMSCWPLGLDWKRYVIRAERVLIE